MRGLLLGAALLWLAAFCVAAEKEPASTMRPPAFHVRAGATVTSGDGWRTVTFDVKNPNAAAIRYVGYTADSYSPALPEGTIAPLYRLELRKGGTWAPYQIGWCGTGRGPVQIAPRSTVAFTVRVPPGEWDAFKVGLTWWKTDEADAQPQTAWSDPVERKEPAARK